ncbi:MAG: transglutaminase domain-containing protein [Planctomycetota bacterium]|jgi:hypothetical protein
MSIDYNDPELYLMPGTQSELGTRLFSEIDAQIEVGAKDMKGIGTIFRWTCDFFDTCADGGECIGKTTIHELVEKRVLGGCHDHSLALASVLRAYGFPAVMVDTAGIQWALDYQQGKRKSLSGHVFLEVFVEGKWILICPTSGRYIEDYDPSNPVIPMTTTIETVGYYALLKGLDPADYGVTSLDVLTKRLEAFADRILPGDLEFREYTMKRLAHCPVD